MRLPPNSRSSRCKFGGSRDLSPQGAGQPCTSRHREAALRSSPVRSSRSRSCPSGPMPECRWLSSLRRPRTTSGHESKLRGLELGSLGTSLRLQNLRERRLLRPWMCMRPSPRSRSVRAKHNVVRRGVRSRSLSRSSLRPLRSREQRHRQLATCATSRCCKRLRGARSTTMHNASRSSRRNG